MRRTVLSCLALILGLTLAACSDDAGTTDKGPPAGDGSMDTVAYPDMGQLWPCEGVGRSCNAHNPCAIDPVCGADHFCHPTSMQDCDDGLDCTDDVCKGLGLCEHTAKANTCALSVPEFAGTDAGVGDAGSGKSVIKCFQKDDQHPADPCQLCDPETSTTAWSPANGGVCDDGDDCTKDDYCQSGTCKGVSYANGGVCDDGDDCTKDDYCQSGTCKGVSYASLCADAYGCTKDLCDGKGGCLGNVLQSDSCLINGTCYKNQASHPDGSCNICDVKTSQSAWTAVSNTCMIGGKCYNASAPHPSGTCAQCDPTKTATNWTTTGTGCLLSDSCVATGTKDSLGCSQCDPTTSTTAWTPLAGVCLIAGKCYQPGDKNPGGSCSECDPTTSATSWTPIANTCFIDSKCYVANDAHPQGCAKCDPAASGTAWTVTDATKCVVNGNCVDKATSIYACGACGVACGAGETCSGGICSCGTLSGTVGSGAVCQVDWSCDQGVCVNLPPGTLGAPFTLDFELANGGLTGTKDWEWGKIGTWAPASNCDSTSSTEPPSQGHSGSGVWGTKLNDCYSPLDNASSTCTNSDTTDDSILSFKVKIPSNWTSASMTFWEWFDLFLTFDWGEIRVDGVVVNQNCSGSKAVPVVWTQKTVNMTPYIGKTVTVAFHMMATSVVQYAGWYIDDLSITGN